MNSQSLNRRVTFERRTAGGSNTPRTWAPVARDIWASVKPAKPREVATADTVVATITHSVMVRWNPALAALLSSAHWRVKYEDKTGAERTLAITGPGRDVQDEGRWIIFDCTEGATDGF